MQFAALRQLYTQATVDRRRRANHRRPSTASGNPMANTRTYAGASSSWIVKSSVLLGLRDGQ